MPAQLERKFALCTPEEAQWALNRDNPNCVWNAFVGNDNAIKELGDIAFDALLKKNHACPGGVALIGLPSTGKTTLPKLFAKIVKLPFIECDRSVRNSELLSARIFETYRAWQSPLVPKRETGIETYTPPPGIIVFDEAHAIRGDWLLKATEPNDGQLITKKFVINTKNILWFLCTTNRGKLPKAFDSRFDKIFLKSYTLAQVATIVEKNFPDFPHEVCEKIATYSGRIPREALSFARKTQRAALRMGCDLMAAARECAERAEIDEDGFTQKHLKIINLLYKNRHTGMAAKRLADALEVHEDDLEEYIMPALMSSVETSNALVRVSTRGYDLTPQGIHMWNKKFLVKEMREEQKSDNRRKK